MPEGFRVGDFGLSRFWEGTADILTRKSAKGRRTREGPARDGVKSFRVQAQGRSRDRGCRGSSDFEVLCVQRYSVQKPLYSHSEKRHMRSTQPSQACKLGFRLCLHVRVQRFRDAEFRPTKRNPKQ